MTGDVDLEVVSLTDGDGTVRPFDADAEPEVVRLSLEAGESVPPHTHPGRGVVFCVLEGVCEVTVDGDTRRLAAGECLQFDGEREVSPAATDDESATALVVLGRS